MATIDSLASLPEHGRPSTSLSVMDSKLASEEKSHLSFDNKPMGEPIFNLSQQSLEDQDIKSAEALRRRQDEVDEVTKEAVELARQHEQEMARLQAEATAKQQAEIKMEAEALARRHAEENARLEAEKLARRQAEEEQARKEQAEAARRRRERAEAHLRRREQELERERARAGKGARPVRDDETDCSESDDAGGKRTNGTIIKNLFHGRSGSTSSNNSGKYHYRQLSRDPKTFSMSRGNSSRSKQRAASQSQAREADLAEVLDKGPPVPLKPTTPEKSLPPPPPPTRCSLQRKPVPRSADETESTAASLDAGFPQRITSLTKRPKAAPPDATTSPTTPKIQTTEAPLIAPEPISATADTGSGPNHPSSDTLPKLHPPPPIPPHPTQPDAPTSSPSKTIVPPPPHPSITPSTAEERPFPHPPTSTPPASAPPPHHRRKSSTSAQDSARLRSLIANANAERDDAIAEVERLKGLLRNAEVERDEARTEVVRVKHVVVGLVGELRGWEGRLGGVVGGDGARGRGCEEEMKGMVGWGVPIAM